MSDPWTNGEGGGGKENDVLDSTEAASQPRKRTRSSDSDQSLAESSEANQKKIKIVVS